MPCPSSCILEENFTFNTLSSDGTGTPVDATGSVDYAVYEDETATAILDGVMTKQSSKTGFYTEQIATTTANGFERFKTYTIRITATVSGIASAHSCSFLCLGASDVFSSTTGALTTLANVKLYLGIPTSNTTDDALLTALINRATAAIQSYTDRTLISTTFRQRYDGDNSRDLVLKEYPIISIDFVSIGTNDAFSITNVNSDAYRATISIEDSTLTAPTMTLEVYGGTNDGSTTITLSDHATLSALETAVNALGTGWTMDVGVSAYDNYDPIELLPTGRLECFNNFAYPKIPDEPLDSFHTYYDEGSIRLPSIASRCCNNVIIKYTAGYATTPADLEQACIAFTSYLYSARGKDFSLKSEKLGDYAYTLADGNTLVGGLPTDVQIMLKQYVKKSGYVC